MAENREDQKAICIKEIIMFSKRISVGYCTYLTIYSGNKLPLFYIGQTTLDKVRNGYHGSVQSKVFKKIWKQEIKEHPGLFKTSIISIHDHREEAINREIYLQQRLDVLNNPLYINRAIGRMVDNKGRKITPEHAAKITASRKAGKGYIPWNKGLKTGKPVWNSGLTKDTNDLIKRMGEHHSSVMKGRPRPAQSKALKERYAEGWSPRCGKKHSEEVKEIIRRKKQGVPQSEEARKNHSNAAKLWWDKRKGEIRC